MAPIIDRILSLLTSSQGNLLYSLVLVITVFGAFQASMYADGRQATPTGKRMQQGLLYLLLAQVVLFLITWLVALGAMDGHSYLPPLDRAIALFSLVLIIWLWAFPKQTPVVDALAAVLEGVIMFTGVISMAWWLRQNSIPFFNTSMLGAYAYYLGIGLLAVGILLLLWKRPSAWGFGLSMLVILLIGYLTQYFIRQPAGDYAWLVRLGEMVAFILLLGLPRRLVTIPGGGEFTGSKKSITSADTLMEARVVQSVIELSRQKSPQEYFQKLTQLVAQLMNADSCLLVLPPKMGGQIIMPMGYSLQDDRAIEGLTADGRNMPSLLEAILTGKTQLIDGSRADSEVHILTSELGLQQPTHILVTPFKPKGSSTEMGIMVLSKASRPVWSEKDASYFMEITNVLASNVKSLEARASDGVGQGDIQLELQHAQMEAETHRQKYAQLKVEYDILTSQAIGAVAGLESTSAVSLLENQKEFQDMVNRLELRNNELENLLSKGRPSTEEVEQLRQELHAALAELAHVPTTLSKSDQKMLDQQLSAMKRLDDLGQNEMVINIAQEFRQPLSAIFGYTGLLLGESTGLLGAIQRKFLERVKASSERLGLLVNELIQVIAIDGGRLDQTQIRVDLEAVIDEAVGNVIAQISEKTITMRVDLPEKMPDIQANKDALLQILANLMHNACLVTPVDGEIKLFARVESKENEPNYMLISVTDQGGGIEKADIPRIFSRRYKVENPLIQGIGDTGVGLSIVKSLVELHKGRVWVDTNLGVGSTFSVLIPLVDDQPDQGNPAIS
ncbi:MAG: hypothetical protein A2032_02165 [Chloroflexi bacterium RBG_19FT_COMBO_49_13]|nr:MAG: hypothetical protein A2032_02165 [Chloroflexi bacterium RBG_19FT_COMBO_49_13]